MFAPRLKLEIRDGHGEKQYATLEWMEPDGSTHTRQELARYYHLKVSNTARWPKATNVQVFLTRVEEPGPDGVYRTTWTGDIPLQWRYQASYPAARTIGAAIDCDLCNVVKDKWIEIRPLIYPNNFVGRRKEPTNMVLTVQARSHEGESEVSKFKIAWDGKWEDGDLEMANHLIVEKYK